LIQDLAIFNQKFYSDSQTQRYIFPRIIGYGGATDTGSLIVLMAAYRLLRKPPNTTTYIQLNGM